MWVVCVHHCSVCLHTLMLVRLCSCLSACTILPIPLCMCVCAHLYACVRLACTFKKVCLCITLQTLGATVFPPAVKIVQPWPVSTWQVYFGPCSCGLHNSYWSSISPHNSLRELLIWTFKTWVHWRMVRTRFCSVNLDISMLIIPLYNHI
jgi:hypothetical protein